MVVSSANVDDLEACALEHHPDKVLADVVNVAFDGADDDLADRLGAGLGKQRAQDLHPALHGIGCEQHFRHEQDAVAEIDTDDPHAFDERIVQDLARSPTTLKEDTGGKHHLRPHAVVEIVVDLLDEFSIVERAQVEFAFSVRHFRPR